MFHASPYPWFKSLPGKETWGHCCHWRPRDVLPASVHSPKAVSRCGRYSSHSQPQCHRSHSRAAFDMPATRAGVFEETKSGERWGSRKGSEHHPFSQPVSIPPVPVLSGFAQSKPPVWASPQVQPTMWTLQRLQRQGTDTVLYLQWNQKCRI